MVKPHALVVDDDEGVCSWIREVALHEGYSVSSVCTGSEALSLLSANREQYDCVFLDLNLPHLHGSELIKHITKLGHKSTKIIVLSGELDSQVYAQLQKFETVMSCHSKPMALNVLRSILYCAASSKGSQKSGGRTSGSGRGKAQRAGSC